MIMQGFVMELIADSSEWAREELLRSRREWCDPLVLILCQQRLEAGVVAEGVPGGIDSEPWNGHR